jgi:hypothetical protein
MPKTKKPVVVWSGARWLVTKRGRPVMLTPGCPLFTSTRAVKAELSEHKMAHGRIVLRMQDAERERDSWKARFDILLRKVPDVVR